MKLKLFIRSSMIITALLVAAIQLGGCGKKKSDEEAAPTSPSMDENVLGDSDSGQALGLQTVNYPYDSFNLDGEAKSKLTANANIMKDKPSLRIQIEGHCDSRGGIQYNIALGEKRANAAKKFLVDQGVEADRVSTISYGKERLLDPAETEQAHAKNRRANFVITSR
jgi:peptidoglycan-associated lipoprotein